MKYLKLIIVCIVVCIATPELTGFDQSRFFHAQYLPQMPRFEKEGLTSSSLRAFAGKTCKQTDCCGTTFQNANYRIQSLILDFYKNIYKGFYGGLSAPFYHIKVQECAAEKKNHYIC